MSEGWRKRIVSGEKPSQIIREFLAGNFDTALLLRVSDKLEDEYIDELDGETLEIYLWRWNHSGAQEKMELSDETLDDILMTKFGYKSDRQQDS